MGSCFTSTRSSIAPLTSETSMTSIHSQRSGQNQRNSSGKTRRSSHSAIDRQQSRRNAASTLSHDDCRALNGSKVAPARAPENSRLTADTADPLTSRDIAINSVQTKRSQTLAMEWSNTHSSGFESISNQASFAQQDEPDDVCQPETRLSSASSRLAGGHRLSTNPAVKRNQSSPYNSWSSVSWRSQSSSSNWSDLDIESVHADNSPAVIRRPKAAVEGKRTRPDLIIGGI